MAECPQWVESRHLAGGSNYGHIQSIARDDFDGEVVPVGEWLYDGTVAKLAEVVAFDCDYFFERMPTDDGRPEWAPHALNEHGLLYYLRTAGELLPLTPFSSVAEAIAWADRQPWAPVTWKKLPI
jgi:hypothetical protein